MNTHSPVDKSLPVNTAEVVQAIHGRGRIVHVFDVADIFGIGGKPVHQIAMQILPIGDEGEARDYARKTRAEMSRRAGPGAEAAANDPEAFDVEQNLEGLFRICLRVDAKGEATRGAAFPGVAWMRENLSADELGTLRNLHDELRVKHGRVPLVIEDEKVEAIATLLAANVNEAIPEQYLAPFPRWYVTHFAVLVSSKLGEARKSLDILLQEREANRAEREALEAENAALRAELAALKTLGV